MEKQDSKKTLIQVSNNVWKQLNDYKTPEDKTFDEVIIKLIKQKEVTENEKSN